MDKNSYDTLEFLATEAAANQFYVLQDDGTVLTVNKEIQFITQVEDVKEVREGGNTTEECAVYTQQYYVDVESNAPQVLGISDDFAITNEDPGVYPDGCMTQPGDSSAAAPARAQARATRGIKPELMIDPPKLDEERLHPLHDDRSENAKQTNNFTEITLSDEQYRVLERKGWLLLESTNNVFVLNALGLHDITANDKLIQKLKTELQSHPDTASDIGSLKIECNSRESPNEFDTSELRIESETSELPIETSDIQTDSVREHRKQNDVVQFLNCNKFPLTRAEPADETQRVIISESLTRPKAESRMGGFFHISSWSPRQRPTSTTALRDESEGDGESNGTLDIETPTSVGKLLNDADDAPQNTCDSIKIKTKYTFTDIPDKIYLGKTVNGKKIYAKVKSRQRKDKEKAKKSDDIFFGEKIDKVYGTDATGLDEAMFTNLVRESFRSGREPDPASVRFAGELVSRLLRSAHIDAAVVGTDVLLTKVTRFETEAGGAELGAPTVVTGAVRGAGAGAGAGAERTFVPLPLLLRGRLADNEGSTGAGATSTRPGDKPARPVLDLFHIHVSETKHIHRQTSHTSVSFTKRKLPLDVLSDAKTRHPNPAHGCGSCGLVFHSAYSLDEHQQDECTEVDAELTIDTDDAATDTRAMCQVIDDGGEKVYRCGLCATEFTRLFNCQKHIKAHKIGKKKKLNAYKCRICPKTYYYPSSLSKHIVKDHIQMQPK